ncbi:MAG: hypothetical protein QW331_03030 [Candidatus Woesearchaeota archaeon]
MADRKLVVDDSMIFYTGLMNFPELYRVIDSFFYEKGYDKWEKTNVERVFPTGRQIDIEMEPWKKITDYFESRINLKIKTLDLKDVEVEMEGVRLNLQQGRLMIKVDAYLRSDYKEKWETPIKMFLRTLLDKYVFKNYYIKHERWVINDVKQLQERIKAHLNTYGKYA